MPRVKASDQNKNEYCNKDIEELRSYQYLLGEFGIAMLTAISRGANERESIMMLSGVPSACITGRMPILLNLELVEKKNHCEYYITTKGKEFLKCIKKS